MFAGVGLKMEESVRSKDVAFDNGDLSFTGK